MSTIQLTQGIYYYAIQQSTSGGGWLTLTRSKFMVMK